MKLIRLCSALSLLCCLASSVAYAEQGADTDWEALNQKASELCDAGDYEGSLAAAKKSLEIARNNADADKSEVAISLSNLAGLYVHQGMYAQAETLYIRPFESGSLLVGGFVGYLGLLMAASGSLYLVVTYGAPLYARYLIG